MSYHVPTAISKSPKPVCGQDVVESIVGGLSSEELVEVTDFDFGTVGAVELFTEPDKHSVLRKAPLLPPVGFIEIQKELIPSDETDGTPFMERSVHFEELS